MCAWSHLCSWMSLVQRIRIVKRTSRSGYAFEGCVLKVTRWILRMAIKHMMKNRTLHFEASAMF
ncbi:hypothetical protein HanRHA438_Chr06g0250381 [Helianthus annuus]|nr:hypothetical protein HanRHA438_Chr06g0250381 [Helianthus annuus]